MRLRITQDEASPVQALQSVFQSCAVWREFLLEGMHQFFFWWCLHVSNLACALPCPVYCRQRSEGIRNMVHLDEDLLSAIELA